MDGVCIPREKRNSQSSGALEEVSGKGHKASTHVERRLIVVNVAAVEVDVAIADVDASSLRAAQWSVHRGDGRSVLEGSQSEHSRR